MYALNRHAAWSDFLDAWQDTGNPVYAKAFDKGVADWTSHNLPGPQHVASGNTTWRTIEAGIRAGGSWPTSFFGFQTSTDFRASTRCAMVAALAEHGRYLLAYGDGGNSNWRSMQYNGLGETALTMPELIGADAWYDHAETETLADMASGVYPDGVEDEETSMYHKVALTNFYSLLYATEEAGRVANPTMKSVVEGMYSYLAYTLDSAGFSPLNSDSDTLNNAGFVSDAAADFGRPDWVYIATNGGNGTEPVGPPSAIFPWAGQLVSRSGWARDAQWSWFDVGPRGSSSHGHLDKLHLSVRIGGVRLLVDSGRFSYDGQLNRFRSDYGAISSGHNVVLVDGQQQVETPAKVTAPLANSSYAITEDQDRARGNITFHGLTGSAVHTRSLLYQRGQFWIVVDRRPTGRGPSRRCGTRAQTAQ